jgi:hypothetical protein
MFFKICKGNRGMTSQFFLKLLLCMQSSCLQALTHSTPMLSVLYIKCNYAVNLLKKQVVWVTNPFELKLYGNIASTKNSSSQRTIYLLR